MTLRSTDADQNEESAVKAARTPRRPPITTNGRAMTALAATPSTTSPITTSQIRIPATCRSETPNPPPARARPRINASGAAKAARSPHLARIAAASPAPERPPPSEPGGGGVAPCSDSIKRPGPSEGDGEVVYTTRLHARGAHSPWLHWEPILHVRGPRAGGCRCPSGSGRCVSGGTVYRVHSQLRWAQLGRRPHRRHPHLEHPHHLQRDGGWRGQRLRRQILPPHHQLLQQRC